MTSPIDICNEALASFAARSTINSFDEASKEAINCKIFYNPTRKALLRAAHWGFARKQFLLSELGNLADLTSPYPWGFKYAYPADCERFRYLVPLPTAASENGIPADAVAVWPLPKPCRDWEYLIANDVDKRCVLTNVPFAIGVYTCDVQDADLWDSLFHDAMVAALAAKLVFPISGKNSLMQEFKQTANDAILIARAADGNEAQATTEHTPVWIAARGLPWGYGDGPGWGAGGGGLWFQGPEKWAM